MLTPDEARALVAEHGSIAAAARAAGVAWTTFHYWLDPERQRQAVAARRKDPAYYERDLATNRRYRDRLSPDAYRNRLEQVRQYHRRRRIAHKYGENPPDYSHVFPSVHIPESEGAA